MPSPVADVIADFARVVGQLGVTWYLFGAQAAILHGVVRLTADVDVTVLLGAVSRRELVDALDTAGFQLRVRDDDAFVAQTQVFPFVHVRTGLPVDVVLGGSGPQIAPRAAPSPHAIYCPSATVCRPNSPIAQYAVSASASRS